MNTDHDQPFVVRFARAFVYAGRGVRAVARGRMFRVQLAAAVATGGLAAWLGITRVEGAILAVTIGGVLALEAMNSAVEACVDLAMPDRHPLAARAKDAAAGAVLIASVAAVAVGLFVLAPRVWERVS